MTNKPEWGWDRQMAESQLSELQNVRVLLEEARGLSREPRLPPKGSAGGRESAQALDEVDRPIQELRSDRLGVPRLPSRRGRASLTLRIWSASGSATAVHGRHR